MKKQKYSIEFSHIYADQKLADKQLASIGFLNDLIHVWDVSYDTVILIDNYNISRQTLNVKRLLTRLGKLGIKPDFWAYEKDMTEYAEELMAAIKVPRVRSRYERYYKSKGKYPCSFLTAAWYLVRFGKLGAGVMNPTGRGTYKPADRLVNILADDYKEVEHETAELLRATKHAKVVDYVQNLFYETPARVGKSKKLAKVEVF